MQACILRSAFRVVTEYRSVPGAKRMVYPQVRQDGVSAGETIRLPKAAGPVAKATAGST